MTHALPDLADIVSLDEFEQLARIAMSHMAYEYVSAGGADEHSLRWNRESFAKLRLRPRILVDVADIQMETTLFGHTMPFPIVLAPTAYQRTMHPDGEVATAAGASAMGTTMIVSTASTSPFTDIARATTSPLWFQLYVQSDRAFTQDLVEHVQEAGCRALCVTVDTPTLGTRDRMLKAKFALPAGINTPHLYDVSTHRRGVLTPDRISITWRDIEWLRSIARVPVLLKGILDHDDAERAIQSGADGIVVSNHGARNLDTVPATIDALPRIAQQVAGRVPVLMDGGVRRGTDIIKAIALGANAVMIGRPYCYGLSVGGAEGVSRVIELLRIELELAMKLCGRASVASIDRSVLWDG
jgi:4-hydroxymandelate oxidase